MKLNLCIFCRRTRISEIYKKLGLSYDKIKDKAIIYDKKMKYEYEEGKDGAKE